MPQTMMAVHVLRAGERADDLLAAVAFALTGNPHFRPESNAGPVARFLVDLPPQEACDVIVRALEEAGDDWHDHLHVHQVP